MSLAEIAKLAGVSTATVSRVMNNSPLVREETATKVRKIADRVGYVPQPVSRDGRRQERSSRHGARNRRIAVITIGQLHHGWMAMPVIGKFVSGVTGAAREFDVDVMLDDMPTPQEISRLVKRNEVGGAILLIDSSASSDPAWMSAIQALAKKLPVVWAMGGHSAQVQLDHVLPDNLGIGYMAATYLKDESCQRVAVVNYSPKWPLTRQRSLMFTSAALDYGMDVTTYLITDDSRDAKRYAGDVQVVETQEHLIEQLRQRAETLDGLFVPRDSETARLHPLLIQSGFKPEEDIRVISCDNDSTQLSMMTPRPATIDLNTHEIARIAIRRLRMRMSHQKESPIVINVPPILVKPHDHEMRGMHEVIRSTIEPTLQV